MDWAFGINRFCFGNFFSEIPMLLQYLLQKTLNSSHNSWNKAITSLLATPLIWLEILSYCQIHLRSWRTTLPYHVLKQLSWTISNLLPFVSPSQSCLHIVVFFSILISCQSMWSKITIHPWLIYEYSPNPYGIVFLDWSIFVLVLETNCKNHVGLLIINLFTLAGP